MWTSLCNFICNKLFHRPELGFQRSDDSCGVYGKRLKLADHIWNTKGLLNQSVSSDSVPMQKQSFDISDDEDDCCFVAEIPRRKKATNWLPVDTVSEPSQSSEIIDIPKRCSSFSFRKNPVEKCDLNVETICSNRSGKDSSKVVPKKFFSTQRSLSQGKLAKLRLESRNLMRKKLNFLQESYRLSEKLKYLKLLQSHVTYNLLTVGNPLKCAKEKDEQIEVISLSDEETNVSESTTKTDKPEEQDVQIVAEVRDVKSFQEMLKCEPLNVDMALKAVCKNNCKNNSDFLKLPENTIHLIDDDDDDDDDDDVNEDEKTEALEEKLRNFMQITAPVYEVENREPHYLPDFTSEQQRKIKNALRPEPAKEVLSAGFGLQITRQDMQTLVGLNWLNDEVINFYMNLIMERSKLNKKLPKVYTFNTFFYPKLVSGGHVSLRRWTKQVDIFSFDLILVPIHLGVHWCLAVIDFQSKSIKYYDSVGSPNHQCLERLLSYLKEESLDKKKKVYPTTDWKKTNVENIPQQMNGSDCGVFSCMFAEYLARNSDILFTQDDMPYFRKKMVIEILEKRLLT